jgi:hypothetical protein
MRVKDVMSSPVVTVPPGMRLKEVADLLVERAISAVPVARLAPLPEPPQLARGVPGVVEIDFTED